MHLFTLVKTNSRAASALTSPFSFRLWGVADLFELLTQRLAFRLSLGLLIGEVGPPTFLSSVVALAVRELVTVARCPARFELFFV